MSIYVGQTIGVQVSKLYDARKRQLVSPVVTISLIRPDHSEVVGVVDQLGLVYFAEFNPDVEGTHIVRAKATAGGGTWQQDRPIRVKPSS